MNEIQAYEPLSAAQIKARVQLIQQVMKSVMKEGTHYGTIPGCKKPCLYKAGSEVLLVTFRIAVEPETEDLSTADEARFRVRVKGVQQESGILLGTGVGECSSNEEKYKWRKAICDAEFDGTPEDRRRINYAKGERGAIYTVKQVRTNIADVANTVLKMAKKRAQIDMTLTTTGASDCFAQDLEDMPEEMREDAPAAPEAPKATAPVEEIPACADCGKPIANDTAEAARVVAWCKDKFGGANLCRSCQGKRTASK